MQTIRFLPDRLNSEPVVFRGFTTHEMGLAALAGAGAGLLLSLPFIPLAGWVVVPTGLLVMPLLLVWFGGRWMARLKRGKPENWLRGVTPDGRVYPFARVAAQTKCAGVCFAPVGQTMFLNLYSPARTIAVRGPF